MPELPEVETARREIHAIALGKTIRNVMVADDRIVYDGVASSEIKAALTGRKIIGSERRGKYFWLQLDQRPWPVFHFGMTGWMHVYRWEKERPRFCKIELLLSSGVRVAMRDPRRLGRIRLRHDPLLEPPVSLLGFDPLHGWPPLRFFLDEMSRRKAPIKAVLLDQSFSAGVGNWIADEVCYQSKIDPRRSANTLAAGEVKQLRTKLKQIIHHAVDVGADDTKFPRTWLFHYRWGKTKGATDGHHRVITFGQVGGRTTAWVESVQK